MATMLEIEEYSDLFIGKSQGIYSSNGVYAGPMIEPCNEDDSLLFGYQIGLNSGGVVQSGRQIETEEWSVMDFGSLTMPSEDFHIIQNGNNQEVFTGATYPKAGDNMRLIDYLDDPKPDADFISNRVDGIAPFAVQFIDTSLNNPVAWKWNFGDGHASTSQNPIHVFSSPGKYTIQLRVYTYTQNDAILKHDYILAGILDFHADHTSGPVKLK